MAKSGTDEHQRTVAVRKCTNGPCTAAYLAIYSFRKVIRAAPTPVFSRKIHVSQGLANAFLNLLGCGQELHFAELGCNGRRLFLSCFFALLRMDCFEHQGNLLHLSLWRHREDVPVKMDRAALVFGFRKDHRDAFQHTKALSGRLASRRRSVLPGQQRPQPKALPEQYVALAKNELYTIFGGRLAEYKYYGINPFRKIALRCPAIHMYETMYSRIPDVDSSSTKTELPARSHASGFSPSRSSSRFASMTLR